MTESLNTHLRFTWNPVNYNLLLNQQSPKERDIPHSDRFQREIKSFVSH